MSTNQCVDNQTGARDPTGNPNATAGANHSESVRAVEATRSLAQEMKEAKAMALHVVERLEEALDLVAASKLESAPQVGARLGDIAKEFGDFLNRFRGNKTVFRLVCNREVVSKIFNFHEEIDEALGGLGEECAWRKRWEDIRDAQQAAFEEISTNKMQLLSDVRGGAQAQSDALAYLLYEFNKVTKKYTEKELQVLNNAFTVLSHFSRNKKPQIQTWFLPSYVFQCDEIPFAWGSYGTVHHGKYGRVPVVVKRVKVTTEASRAAFVSEANTWFKANAIPNVLQLYGAHHLGPEPYFVCAFAANQTLSDFLSDRSNHHHTYKLLLDAAEAVHALHGLEILHNDLKCNNILVTSDVVAKLIDFGLSAQLFALDVMSVRKPEGALKWKAPELLSEKKAASYASDVYSLAMCIYEAVTQTLPYGGVTDAMILRNVEKGKHGLPKRPDSVFTDEQWKLIADMAAVNPDDRISMDEVVKRLAKFTKDEFDNNLAAQSAMPNIDMTLKDTTEEEGCNESEREYITCADDKDGSKAPPASSNQDGAHSGSATTELQVVQHSSPVELLSPQFVVVTEATISDFVTVSSGKKGIEYCIVLRVQGGEDIRIRRRYSDLRSLRKILTSKFQQHMASAPPFPSRKPFSFRDLDAIATERCESLSTFVQFVVQHTKLPVGFSYGNNETAYTPGTNPDNLRSGAVLL